MIFGIYLATVGATTGIRLLKNVITKEKIKENGKIIVESNRSPILRVTSFIKEYGYLLVPFYNIIKTFKNSGDKFYSSYFDYLNENKMISTKEVSKVEKKSEVKKTKTLPEIKKDVVKEKKQLPNIIANKQNVSFSQSCVTSDSEFNNLVSYILGCNDFNELHNMYSTIYSKEQSLRNAYNNLVPQGNVSKLNEISLMVSNCDTLLKLIYSKFISKSIDRTQLTLKK